MKHMICIFSLLFFLSASCDEAKDSASEEKMEDESTEMGMDAAEESPSASSETTMPSGEAYTTKVVKDGIPSPRKEMTATVGDATVLVNYGSPSVRGRTIWGDLEPYDEVWRTGANEATTIEFSKDVEIEGKKLAAGTYALFTIPRDGNWTVIFNKKSDQWGDYNYEEGDDALRVDVTPMKLSEKVEQLEFLLMDNKVVLRWDDMAVPFMVAG